MSYNNYISFYKDVEEAELEEPDKELRTERIIIRVTPSEKKQIKEDANKFHMKMSAYIRMKVYANFVGVSQGNPHSKAEKLKDVKKKVQASPARVEMVKEMEFVFKSKVKIDIKTGLISPSEAMTAEFKESVIDVKDLAKKEQETRRKILERDGFLHPPTTHG